MNTFVYRTPRACLTALLLLFAAACDSGDTLAPPDPEVPDPPVGPQPPDFPTIPAIGPAVYTDDGYRLVPIARGLEHPWGLAFLPSGELLVTERPGRLRLVRDGSVLPSPLAGAPEAKIDGQAGLLDLALHPSFWTDSLVYMTFAAATGEGVTTQVARARFNGSALLGTEVIWSGVQVDASLDNHHFGSRIVFDLDGYLYVSMGDRHVRHAAQDKSNHHGSISRIHEDGRIPDDNPFVGQSNVPASLFAYGMRNPQGLAIHPTTGHLLESEHGPRHGDELNVVEAGDNLGWPVISWGTDFDGSPITAGQTEAPGMEQPLFYWGVDRGGIAPSGIDVYTGDVFPNWTGDVFIAALGARQLFRLDLNGIELAGSDPEPLLGDWGKRIRHVRNGPDGLLYILTDEDDGGIYRLEPVTD